MATLDTGTFAPASEAAPAELGNAAWILELVLMRVRLRARRRLAWLTSLGQVRQREHPVDGLAAVPPAGGSLEVFLDHRDTPDAEASWYERSAIARPVNEELASVEQALAGASGSALHELRRLFGMSGPEMDLLQACLALALEPALGTVYGSLQQGPVRSCASAPLVARLFGHGRGQLWNPGWPVAVWGLVSAGEATPGEPAPLAVDPLVIDWLQGELRLDPALRDAAQMIEPRKPLEQWPVEETARAVQRTVERGSAVRVLVSGPPSSGRRTFGAAVAARFGTRMLAVDTSEITDSSWPDLYMRAQRLVTLGGMALAWHGSQLHRCWPREPAPAPLQFVAHEPDQPVAPCDHLVDHQVELPAPTLDDRRELWRAGVSESAVWPPADFEALCVRHRLNPGDIVKVAGRGPASAREAARAARELTRHRLGDLGRLLDCPFTWDDLVVPARLREALEDFTFEATDRVAFWETPAARRLFPRGTGLVALFSGPPGTGKTMAAQVIAADMDLDLFRIDLAAVVSKYIGETAKHLAQIFARAARMNGVLLFDEADALFSKRTEVKDSHDRYANADTSYLLQLLEEYRGIVVLATNRKQNIDPAFIRRVRYVFEFPRPDAAERLRIWRQVVAALGGPDTLTRLERTIGALAEGVDLSGAQIKNAVLASMFVARRSREALAMPHLLRGVDRELAKEGRSLGQRERESLTRHG